MHRPTEEYALAVTCPRHAPDYGAGIDLSRLYACSDRTPTVTPEPVTPAPRTWSTQAEWRAHVRSAIRAAKHQTTGAQIGKGAVELTPRRAVRIELRSARARKLVGADYLIIRGYHKAPTDPNTRGLRTYAHHGEAASSYQGVYVLTVYAQEQADARQFSPIMPGIRL